MALNDLLRYKLNMFKIITLLSWLFLLNLSRVAEASESNLNPTQANTIVSTYSDPFDPNKPFFDLRHEAYASGPTFRAMDGRDEGRGPKLLIEHSLRPGYYFGNYWKTRVLINANQRILPDRSGQKTWQFTDPALGLQKAAILKAEKHGVDWRLEGYYYFPVSKRTKENVGTEFDTGSGIIRVQSRIDAGPIGGTPIWVSARWNSFFFLKKNPIDKTLSEYFQLFNKIGYAVNDNFSPYIGYNNYFDWNRDGRKSPWRKNQAGEVGVFYNFTPDTYVNFFLETPLFQLKDTQIWLGFDTRLI